MLLGLMTKTDMLILTGVTILKMKETLNVSRGHSYPQGDTVLVVLGVGDGGNDIQVRTLH